MNRAMLHVITGSVRLARGEKDAAARSVMTARGALRSVRYEDQHQLPLARLEILLALAADGPAAGLAAASQTMDRFELGGSSPRYGWPVVTAGAFAVLAAARLAGPSHDERLRDEALGVADRLRTVAEKLETFGPAQRACALTFAAADANAARLIAGFPDAGHGDASGSSGSRLRLGRSGSGLGLRLGRPAPGTAGLLAAWDEAAVAWDGLGEPYPLGETLLHAAEAALACGDRDGAAERLQRAAPLAGGLGARPLSDEIALLARRARIRLGADGSASVVSGDGGAGAGEFGELGLGLPNANSRCSAWSRPGAATGRSPASCSSRPRRPASTCRTSWASWAWPAAARRPPRRTASASSTPPASRNREARVSGCSGWFPDAWDCSGQRMPASGATAVTAFVIGCHCTPDRGYFCTQ